MVSLSESMWTFEDIAHWAKVHHTTVRAWHRDGVQIGSSVVKLHMVRIGRIYRTSRDNVLAFMATLDGEQPAPVQPVAPNIYHEQAMLHLQQVHGV